jgi:DNA polymerase (family X)
LKSEKLVAGKSEEEIYAKLNLDYIPPELRENLGEIDAAEKHTLAHSHHSGRLAGRRAHAHRRDRRQKHDRRNGRGRQGARLQIHGHHRPLQEPGFRQRPRRQARRGPHPAHSRGGKKIDGITIFAGIEVDILADGDLDLSDDVLAQMDVVIASVHSVFNQEPAKMTERLLKAVENPNTSIIGHPTGRLQLRRDAYQFDMDAILTAAAAKHKVAMELNSYPDRLDLNDVHLRQAKQRGVKIVINTDSHHTSHLDKIRYGILQARRAWLTKDDVLNTLTAERFAKAMKHGWN